MVIMHSYRRIMVKLLALAVLGHVEQPEIWSMLGGLGNKFAQCGRKIAISRIQDDGNLYPKSGSKCVWLRRPWVVWSAPWYL
jgi:hypothetical protein